MSGFLLSFFGWAEAICQGDAHQLAEPPSVVQVFVDEEKFFALQVKWAS